MSFEIKLPIVVILILYFVNDLRAQVEGPLWYFTRRPQVIAIYDSNGRLVSKETAEFGILQYRRPWWRDVNGTKQKLPGFALDSLLNAKEQIFRPLALDSLFKTSEIPAEFADEHSPFIGSRIDSQIFEARNLSLEKFYGAQMRFVVANFSDIRGSDFNSTDMRFGVYRHCRMDHSLFFKCNADSTEFTQSDLTRTAFIFTSLKGADFSGAILDRTTFGQCDMSGVVFEPTYLPNAEAFAFAQHLDEITFRYSSSSLVKMKTLLRNEGYTAASKDLIAAVHRKYLEDDWAEGNYLSFFSQKLLFELPCGFGSRPLRPLWLMLFLWLLCSLVYSPLLFQYSPVNYLYLITSGKKRTSNRGLRTIRLGRRLDEALTRDLLFRSIKIGAGFSLANLFQIGYKELTPGVWLRQGRKYDYEVKAMGWPRTVGLLQSLIGAYLLVLTLLSQFTYVFDL